MNNEPGIAELPIAEACVRNQRPILDVLGKYAPDNAFILEVGSGTGQHAAYMTANLPGTPQRLGIEDMFDPDLMEHNILLPLRNRLTDVYDYDIGLDIWLPR